MAKAKRGKAKTAVRRVPSAHRVKKTTPQTHVHTHHKEVEYHPTKAVAIVSLIVNILLIPGLGTIIGGRTKAGVWQIILLCVGLLTVVIVIGIPILVATWIWALVSSIKILQEAE